MRPEARACLWDALHAAELLRDFSQGRSFEGYCGDALLRSGAERQFEIIGESLNRLSRIEPGIAGEIPDLPRIVAFRNVLIHVTPPSTTLWSGRP